jgi:two-component system LytT family response regulator
VVERKVVIKERDEITILKQSDIEWVDAAGDYVCLHADGETHIKRSTLKELLAELDENIFKRVHRSTIVNLNFIEKVIPHTKGEFFLQLGEFDKIKVSRNYKDAIKHFLAGE